MVSVGLSIGIPNKFSDIYCIKSWIAISIWFVNIQSVRFRVKKSLREFYSNAESVTVQVGVWVLLRIS